MDEKEKLAGRILELETALGTIVGLLERNGPGV